MVKLGILDGKLQFQLMLYLTTWALWVHRYIQVLSLDGIYDSWCHHVIGMADCRFGRMRGVFGKQAKKTKKCRKLQEKCDFADDGKRNMISDSDLLESG
jgi:hypothetical protein